MTQNKSIKKQTTSTNLSQTVPQGTINLNNLSVTGNLVGAGSLNIPYYSLTTGINTGYYSINAATSPTPSINLDNSGIHLAAECDIRFGNSSLKTILEGIESRLALLRPNPELENEWAELKDLGDQYRKLEKEIQEKMKTWNILKDDSN